MLKPAQHRSAPLPTSSVADIAFLLLSFFLMTTEIADDKGLTLVLPEWLDEPVQAPYHERNIFNVHINSNDAVMIEGEISTLAGLKERVKTFILNPQKRNNLAETTQKAVVSLKSERGTSHGMFMSALDEIQGAYYEIYADRLGMSVKQFRKLNPQRAADKALLLRARQDLPMNISLAEH